MSKISIRIFDEKEVRAIWCEQSSKWWFSVLDVISVLRGESDYNKNRNYWKYLKTKLINENSKVVSATNQFKFTAPDGKRRLSDALNQDGIKLLGKEFPSKSANKFIEWFTYSDETIDGKSKQKAYSMFDSSFIESIEIGTIKGLRQIHGYLFGGLYDFAGQIRNGNISKGGFKFANVHCLSESLATIDNLPEDTFDQIVDKYVEMNIAHPFREGNGRSTRIWLDLIFKRSIGKCVDWSKINKKDYFEAMIQSHTDNSMINTLLKQALTDKINDREMFMKGIDYSYYYEEEDIEYSD